MKALSIGICLLFANPCLVWAGDREPASFFEKRFTINFKNTSVEDALNLIASKANLHLKLQGKLSGKINYAMVDSSLEDAMEKISEDNKLDYRVKDGTLVVGAAKENARSPASIGDTNGTLDDMDLIYRSIPINYSNAREMTISLLKTLHQGESLVADDVNNTLIVYSSQTTFKKIESFVALYDRRPFQILIEAQIVETTKNFARDLGISWGDLNATSGSTPNIGGGILTPAPSNPNIVMRALMGTMDGRILEANLQAAETRGDAKVVSRPKVFTLNNRKATIHSGITYNIRTLSNVIAGGGAPSSGSPSTPGSTSGTSIAGGLMSISSGLELDVTPTVVGAGLVRLALKVTNSEPDTGAAVDGIPGINDNSAETAILVQGGQTATIAGLLKNAVSNTQQGVPWLSHLPVIGWLFSSHSDRDTTSELMIFITPHVVDAVGEQKSASQK